MITEERIIKGRKNFIVRETATGKVLATGLSLTAAKSNYARIRAILNSSSTGPEAA